MTLIVLFFPLLPTAILIAQAVLLTQRGQLLRKMLVGIRIVYVDSSENGELVTNLLKYSVPNYMLDDFPLYSFIDALFIYCKDHP